MKPENLEEINRSFAVQAGNFESKSLNFSKQEFLDYSVTRTAPGQEDRFLEVAAGTCACGRAFAPHVKAAVCLDATPQMLEVGKSEADKAHLSNMVFVRGFAEDLPFLDASFDIVFSRLAFHHFPDPGAAFSEMARVLAPGGKLVVIDMEAAPEDLRGTEDEIETLRDPSHVKNLSRSELTAFYKESGLTLSACETTNMRQHLQNWLALTQTPSEVRACITSRMRADLSGGEKTGFFPYILEAADAAGDADRASAAVEAPSAPTKKTQPAAESASSTIAGGGDAESDICFDQRWLLLIGEKAAK